MLAKAALADHVRFKLKDCCDFGVPLVRIVSVGALDHVGVRVLAEGMGLTSNLLQYKSLILFDAHSCY
ncbi:hypothetical protein ACFQ33_19955, partial [Mycoplana ramosa]